MASGWLRGTVKEVPSGDTVVIAGAAKVVPPPEKRITLSSLVAPKLVRPSRGRSTCWLAHTSTCAQGRRDGTKDEAFAWESREFLRKKLIGQVLAKHQHPSACATALTRCTCRRRSSSRWTTPWRQSETASLDLCSSGRRMWHSRWCRTAGPRSVGAAVLCLVLPVCCLWLTSPLVQVRASGSQQSPYIEDLKKAEEGAQGNSVGLWTKVRPHVTHQVQMHGC
jgi:staphylococcal nuclease domain-containing protein 1